MATTGTEIQPEAGDGKVQFDVLSEDIPPLTSLYAITIPGAMKVTGAVVNQVGQTPYYDTVDVRRPIAEAKVAAVKAVLAASGTYTLCYGGNGVGGAYSDARGFRARFSAKKTEAQLNTFLAAVETAAT